MEFLDGGSLKKTIVRLTVFPLAWKDGYTRGFARRVNMLHKDPGVHCNIKSLAHRRATVA
jgi:hypothetical protein